MYKLLKTLNKYNGNICFAGEDEDTDFGHLIFEADRYNKTVEYTGSTKAISDVCCNNVNSYIVAFSDNYIGEYSDNNLDDQYVDITPVIASKLAKSTSGYTYILDRPNNNLVKYLIGNASPTIWTFELPDYSSRYDGKILYREADGVILYYNNSDIYAIRDDNSSATLLSSLSLEVSGDISLQYGGEFNASYCFARAMTDLAEQSSSSSSSEEDVRVKIDSISPADESNEHILSNARTLSFDHVICGESDRILIVGVQGEKDGSVAPVTTSVTYNGQSLYRVITHSHHYTEDEATDNSDLWCILENDLPAAGRYKVVVTMSEQIKSVAAMGISVYHAKQEYPILTSFNHGKVNVASTISGVTAGSLIIDSLSSGTAISNPVTTGIDQRRQYRETGTVNGNVGCGSTRIVANGGDVTFSWFASSATLTQVVAEFRAFGPYFESSSSSTEIRSSSSSSSSSSSYVENWSSSSLSSSSNSSSSSSSSS